MLKGIDPILGPDLLAILRAMGHGDELVLADANFPASALARRLVRMDGVAGARALQAIVSVLPLDTSVTSAARRMEISDNPESLPEACLEYAAILKHASYDGPVTAIERHAFYAQARDAYAIVATGELRLWANLILKKGAIPPGLGHPPR